MPKEGAANRGAVAFLDETVIVNSTRKTLLSKLLRVPTNEIILHPEIRQTFSRTKFAQRRLALYFVSDQNYRIPFLSLSRKKYFPTYQILQIDLRTKCGMYAECVESSEQSICSLPFQINAKPSAW
jgi:hypothetical protein